MSIQKVNDLIVDNMYLCWSELKKNDITSCFILEDKINFYYTKEETTFHDLLTREHVKSLLYAFDASRLFRADFKCASDLIEDLKRKYTGNQRISIYEVDVCLKKVLALPKNESEFYEKRKYELKNYENTTQLQLKTPSLIGFVKKRIVDFFDENSIQYQIQAANDASVLEFKFSIGAVEFIIGTRTSVSVFDDITRGNQNFYFRYKESSGEIKPFLLKDSLPNRFADIGVFESIEEFLFVVDANMIPIKFYFGLIKNELSPSQ